MAGSDWPYTLVRLCLYAMIKYCRKSYEKSKTGSHGSIGVEELQGVDVGVEEC